jgi:hypothetical protein
VANEDEGDEDAVTALEALRAEPSRDFFRRLRGSIERRVLGSQVLEMGVESLAEVVLQYLAILMRADAQRKDKGGPHD